MTLRAKSKIVDSTLSEEMLKKYIRVLEKEEFLFHQNDMGNTMFIVVSGSLDLLEARNGAQFLVGTLGAGQVLGEKAMLTENSYRRTYSARASQETTLMEFSNKNLKLVETLIPNFTTRILQIAAKRLDRANQLITLLRSMDPSERVIKAILFLAEEVGTKSKDGIEVAIGADDIHHICAVEKETIEECLKALLHNKVLLKTATGFLITDENALDQFLPDLRERLAA